MTERMGTRATPHNPNPSYPAVGSSFCISCSLSLCSVIVIESVSFVAIRCSFVVVVVVVVVVLILLILSSSSFLRHFF